MPFPFQRSRRLRRTPALRALVRETGLDPAHLIQPLFVRSGRGVREPIAALPGQLRFSPDEVVREAAELAERGLGGVLLFGLPESKDGEGSGAWDARGPVAAALAALRAASTGLVLAADVCLCAYTDHGHCGVLAGTGVDNDATLPLLARAAAAYAAAGADIVAPSAMMDGQVAALRAGLDAEDHDEVAIMGYSAKYASAFFGPFREAADSAPSTGDRRGYQMDAANAREARREIAADLDEGADIIMVKPALAYLDVIREAADTFDAPIAAYSVSGEYAMVKAAAERGWLDERAAALELLTAIRRAGADILITYFAKDAAAWLRQEGSA
ncbi:MAG: porphobilinogen synthase [Gemmatimonadota bacterium]